MKNKQSKQQREDEQIRSIIEEVHKHYSEEAAYVKMAVGNAPGITTKVLFQAGLIQKKCVLKKVVRYLLYRLELVSINDNLYLYGGQAE